MKHPWDIMKVNETHMITLKMIWIQLTINHGLDIIFGVIRFWIGKLKTIKLKPSHFFQKEELPI